MDNENIKLILESHTETSKGSKSGTDLENTTPNIKPTNITIPYDPSYKSRIDNNNDTIQGKQHQDFVINIGDLVEVKRTVNYFENEDKKEDYVKESKNTSDGNAEKRSQNIDFLIYEYFGQQIQPPKTTLVMMQGVGPGQGPPVYDEEPFSDNESRNAFIRLVFIILLVMLLITSAFVATVLAIDDMRYFFVRYGIFLMLGASFVMIGMSYAIMCSPCMRVPPSNIIMLVVTVICMSLICAYVTSRYKTQIVLLALVTTCVVVGICFLLALSRFDFTSWLLYIVMASAAISVIGIIIIIAMFVFNIYFKPLHIALLIVFSVMNVIILAMEIQMVLGGRTVQLDERDYALGAFLLYTSIVHVFLNCVQLLGISFDDLF